MSKVKPNIWYPCWSKENFFNCARSDGQDDHHVLNNGQACLQMSWAVSWQLLLKSGFDFGKSSWWQLTEIYTRYHRLLVKQTPGKTDDGTLKLKRCSCKIIFKLWTCFQSSEVNLLVNLFSKLYVTSLPKLLDRIQLNLVCSFLTWVGCARVHLFLPPPPPPAGLKGQIIIKFNYKVNLKIFLPKFVHIFSNDRRLKYWTGFWLCLLGHALGVTLRGSVGVKNLVFQHIVMWHIKLKGMMSRISDN